MTQIAFAALPIHQIQLADLPSVVFLDYRTLPNIPACYLVIEDCDNVIYVGQSSTLALRWGSHHKLEQLKERNTNIKIAWIECKDTNLLPILERQLILHFKPELNVKQRSLFEPKLDKEKNSQGDLERIKVSHKQIEIVRGYGKGLVSYWLLCWESAPFDDDFVLMKEQDFSSTTNAKYRKILESLGLFTFEKRRCDKQKSLWVKNLHKSH